MSNVFPAAVPEIPVVDLKKALSYYEACLGFTVDWVEEIGIAGISKGDCRMFLCNKDFRERHRNEAPVLVWLNLDSKEAVDNLHRVWRDNKTKIVSPPESKSWGLHEFTAADPDGNLFRVFYDFTTPEREKNNA